MSIMFVYLVWAGVNAFPKYHLAKVFNRPSFCIGCAEVKAREISLQRMNRIDVTYMVVLLIVFIRNDRLFRI